MLKPQGEELWAAEGPLRLLGVQAGRRMGVIRLRRDELLIHSPMPLTAPLRDDLDAIGQVRYVVPASRLHGHLFMEQYAEEYPDAELFAAPGLARRRRDLRFAAELGDEPDPRWADALEQTIVRGHRQLDEVVFCHRQSRTLLVGDLCWNVTRAMSLSGRLWAGWRQGVRPTPAFRLGFRDRPAARESIERILAWDFDRILIGHGEVVRSDGREALRSAYGWLLS